MKLRFLWMAGALVLIPVLGFPTAQPNPVGKSVDDPSKAIVNSRPIRTKSFPVRPESERQQVCCQIVRRRSSGITSPTRCSASSAAPISFAGHPPHPEAADPVQLQVSKTWDSATGTWQVTLSWSGGAAPYGVSYSTDPSFQLGDRTLAENSADTTMTVDAHSSANLECFAVTDADGVSQAVQGSGSNPHPELPPPTIQQNGRWWGNTVQLNGNYLDLIPQENTLYLGGRIVKGNAVQDGGNGFASQVSFTIPDDARGVSTFVSTHGMTPESAPFLSLYPPGLPAYTDIRCIVYCPQNGTVWVAADNRVDEIDLFQHTPVVTPIAISDTKPYISQCTTDGHILVVDGVAGVGEIDQIDVSNGHVSVYANTSDTNHTPNFTRSILPVGIAVDPDGSAAYIADATGGYNASTMVRFPAGNGSAITDDYGNFPYWAFPDPCPMDVGLTHQLYAGDATQVLAYVDPPGSDPELAQTWWYLDISVVPHELFVDRDVSNTSLDRLYYGPDVWCMAYNQNPIADVYSTPVRHLGADVFAENGHMDVESLWEYALQERKPIPVILNNAGQSVPYPSASQVADRVVKLTVRGWSGVELMVRLVDPPDASAYAPDAGWAAKGSHTAEAPYDVYDNDVWTDTASTDWGLSATLPGTLSGPVLSLKVTPGSNNTADFYVKLPPRYAGDNREVEVQKEDLTGALVPDEMPYLSAPLVGWKRVYVERDHMFRRGGFLYAPDSQNMTISAGTALLPVSKGPGGEQIDNLSVGDEVAIFDAQSTLEGLHDTAYIGAIDRTSNADYTLVSLTQSDLLTPYTTHCGYTASPIDATSHYPDFSVGQSAAIGVIHSADGQITDTDSNQINGPGSAFYDPDMRDIQQPYDDAYVEFIAPRSGMGAVPYIDEAIPFYDAGIPGGPEDSNRLDYEAIWSPHGLNTQTPNYIYLLGCKGRTFTGSQLTAGITVAPNHYSYIYVNSLDTWGQAQSPPFTQEQAIMATQYDTDHEIGHEFLTNRCTTTPACPGATPFHDNRSWWNYSTTGCPASDPCLEEYSIPNPPTGINRFCKEDLFLGDPNCSGTPRPGAIRTYQDPLP